MAEQWESKKKKKISFDEMNSRRRSGKEDLEKRRKKSGKEESKEALVKAQ